VAHWVISEKLDNVQGQHIIMVQ